MSTQNGQISHVEENYPLFFYRFKLYLSQNVGVEVMIFNEMISNDIITGCDSLDIGRF